MRGLPAIHQCEVFWRVPIPGTAAPNDPKHKVGTLVRDQENLYFAYDAEWLRHGIEISPNFLPLDHGTQPVSLTDPRSESFIEDLDLRNEFRGLPGPFYDSLPDKWGMRLLSNFTGKEPDDLAALDILCHRGNRCMGAFSYEPAAAHEPSPSPFSHEDLELYCRHAAQVSSGNEPQSLMRSIMDALEDSGGSAGGMRPKMLLAIQSGFGGDGEAPTLRRLAGYDHEDMPATFEPWLLKFDTEPEACRGRIEQACAEMARAAGVDLPPTDLISTTSSTGIRHSHFAVRRFDRQLVDGKWQRVHMHTAAGILQRDFNALDLDYTDILELVRILTGDPEQIRQAYTRAVFNVLAGNSDDHAKNHAFLLDAGGEWRISPAYDLTPSRLRLQPGIRSTSVLGEKKEKVPLATLMELAHEHGVVDPLSIIRQVAEAVRKWRDFTKAAGIPTGIAERYERRMKELHPQEFKKPPATRRKPPADDIPL